MKDKIFADGFSFKRRDNAPDFVVGGISVKVSDAIAFLKAHEKNGWVNLNVNRSKTGTYYMELDTFEPSKERRNVPNKSDDYDDVAF